MKRLGQVLILILILAAAGTIEVPLIGAQSGQQQSGTATSPFGYRKEADVVNQIFFEIQDKYLYNIDLAKCRTEILKKLSPVRTAEIAGNTVCLDKYSYYYTPEEAKDFMTGMSGRFGGIGVELEANSNAFVVRKVMEDSPAEKVGILAGDVIVKIRQENEKDYSEIKDLNDAVSKIRGPVGTKVFIMLLRSGNILQFEVVRQDVAVKLVERKIFGDVGYVHLKWFSQTSADELEENLRALRGKGINKVIFDLRNNPGGDLHAALEILFYFGKKDDDIMLTLKYKKSEEVHTIKNSTGKYIDPKTNAKKSPGEFSGMKMVVLINGRSASASEVAAGTLQDWGYKVIGENSYRKGVGQTMITLIDGSILKFTTFEFLVGNGKHKVNNIGIKPDIEVEWQPQPNQKIEDFAEEYNKSFADPAKDRQLQIAIEEVNKL